MLHRKATMELQILPAIPVEKAEAGLVQERAKDLAELTQSKIAAAFSKKD
jgi:hypothetical protein